LKAYFIRRLLLIPFTILGITALVFSIVVIAPGGPVERNLAGMMGGNGVGKRSRAESSTSLTPATVLEQEEKYDRDKPGYRSYAEWLGLVPRDVRETKIGKEFRPGEKTVEIALPGSVLTVTVERDDAGTQARIHPQDGVDLKLWKVRLRTPQEQRERWKKWTHGMALTKDPDYRAVVYQSAYDGLLEGSLGTSEKYQDPVWDMILSKMPVSIYFGLVTLIITYLVCVPLGIVKAVRHRSFVDNSSSFAIMVGYAIPGYALASILLLFLGVRWGLLPIRGFTGDNFDSLSTAGKIKDLAAHTVMPLAAYLVGSFATTTMLVKNNLMDNLAADYVRTAMAKGVSYPSAVIRHAFRNSLIPLASTFGDIILVLVGGSILIERIFDIDGFGLLQFTSLLEEDVPVIMGVVVVSSFLMLLGNVVSDFCVALVDPKVSYT
jgi:microcin C transport system permease protein